MKKIISVILLSAIAFNLPAEGIWKSIKDGASSAADSVSEGVKSVTEGTLPDEARAEIIKIEKDTMNLLFKQAPAAKAQYDEAYGYAVFDTRKFAFMITTEYGAGVAVNRQSSKRTYMKMASGGVNVGLGGEFYQIVFLFRDKKVFDAFVEDGYQAGSEATATAGSEAERGEVNYVNGMATYKLNPKGLKLTLDITGTKFWQDDKLNN